MFSRNVSSKIFSLSENLLPSNGSNHAAFVEMSFIWKEVLEEDDRLRAVKLPYGFSLKQVDEEKLNIIDSSGFVRSLVSFSKNSASITPVKRFSFEVISNENGNAGIVRDWDTIVYRTPVSRDQKESVELVKNWLFSHKPRWESYISPINFERV